MKEVEVKRFRLAKFRSNAVAAAVSIEDVQRAFYDEIATEESGRYWWWICEIYLEPNELIVEDLDDQLYRVPFTIYPDGAPSDSEDVTEGDAATETIEFGDPVPVRMQFVDARIGHKPMAEAARAAMRSFRGSKLAASYASRADSPGAHLTSAPNQEGAPVDINALRTTLGLPADTPEAEVLRIANERLGGGSPATPPDPAAPPPAVDPAAQPETPPVAPEAVPAPSTDPATAPPPAVPVVDPAATPPESGVVQIDASALASLQAAAQQGVVARRQQIADADEAILNAAIGKGKFGPARKAHFKKLLDVDREGTITMLASLAENVVPVTERGMTSGSDGLVVMGEDGHRGGVRWAVAPSGVQVPIGYPPGWLPEVANRLRLAASLAEGNAPAVMSDNTYVAGGNRLSVDGN